MCLKRYAPVQAASKKDLHIVNVGCAGSHTTGVRTLIKPNAFIQRDMDARQFNYERYRTLNRLNGLSGDVLDHDLTVVCATGDNANGCSKHQTKSQPLTLWTWRLMPLHMFVPTME